MSSINGSLPYSSHQYVDTLIRQYQDFNVSELESKEMPLPGNMELLSVAQQRNITREVAKNFPDDSTPLSQVASRAREIWNATYGIKFSQVPTDIREYIMDQARQPSYAAIAHKVNTKMRASLGGKLLRSQQIGYFLRNMRLKNRIPSKFALPSARGQSSDQYVDRLIRCCHTFNVSELQSKNIRLPADASMLSSSQKQKIKKKVAKYFSNNSRVRAALARLTSRARQLWNATHGIKFSQVPHDIREYIIDRGKQKASPSVIAHEIHMKMGESLEGKYLQAVQIKSFLQLQRCNEPNSSSSSRDETASHSSCATLSNRSTSPMLFQFMDQQIQNFQRENVENLISENTPLPSIDITGLFTRQMDAISCRVKKEFPGVQQEKLRQIVSRARRAWRSHFGILRKSVPDVVRQYILDQDVKKVPPKIIAHTINTEMRNHLKGKFILSSQVVYFSSHGRKGKGVITAPISSSDEREEGFASLGRALSDSPLLLESPSLLKLHDGAHSQQELAASVPDELSESALASLGRALSDSPLLLESPLPIEPDGSRAIPDGPFE